MWQNQKTSSRLEERDGKSPEWRNRHELSEKKIIRGNLKSFPLIISDKKNDPEMPVDHGTVGNKGRK